MGDIETLKKHKPQMGQKESKMSKVKVAAVIMVFWVTLNSVEGEIHPVSLKNQGEFVSLIPKGFEVNGTRFHFSYLLEEGGKMKALVVKTSGEAEEYLQSRRESGIPLVFPTDIEFKSVEGKGLKITFSSDRRPLALEEAEGFNPEEAEKLFGPTGPFEGSQWNFSMEEIQEISTGVMDLDYDKVQDELIKGENSRVLDRVNLSGDASYTVSTTSFRELQYTKKLLLFMVYLRERRDFLQMKFDLERMKVRTPAHRECLRGTVEILSSMMNLIGPSTQNLGGIGNLVFTSQHGNVNVDGGTFITVPGDGSRVFMFDHLTPGEYLVEEQSRTFRNVCPIFEGGY